MGTAPSREEWLERKRHLKRQLGLWIIRREDITGSLDAWLAWRKAVDAQPRDFIAMRRAFVACVADYGRIFSGDDHLTDAKLSKTLTMSPEDTLLHAELKKLRNEAVAHSDWSYRAIRMIPPGAQVDGFPTVPAHRLGDWRWLAKAVELRVDIDHVERWLRAVQKSFEEMAFAALDRLMEHCKGEILVATETPLEDF